MRVLVTGSGGQLGRELQATCPTDVELIPCPRSELDITRAAPAQALVLDARPDVIVNAAAYTAVDRAESESERAFAVNADGPAHLALAAKEIGARLLHVSTDFVFDGRQGHPYTPGSTTDPQSVYGASKLAGEQRVLEVPGCRATVVRTSWVYSRFRSNFVKTMLRLMSERQVLSVVADQIGVPTWARSVAGVIWALHRRPELGRLYHWTDAGVASWYDFAVAIQDEATDLGLATTDCTVVPVTTEEFPTAARRPAYSVMDSTSTRHDLDLQGTHWRHQLRAMLEQLRELGET